jgi:hypothetical protein
MKCQNCNDTGLVIYEEKAPSPPYKEGTTLEYGKRCECVEKERLGRL